MQLQAVMVPPQSVLEDALAAARTIYLMPEATLPKSGMAQRLFQRRNNGHATAASQVMVTASEGMFIRLARFGNVTSSDARNLALALGEVAATWPAPVVHVADLAIELTDTHLVINAQLDGDLDGLRAIFGNLNGAAKAEGFFLDRRSFRPEFSVASIDLPDDPSFLDRLEWEVDIHRGPDWRATNISFMRVTYGDKAQTFEEVDSLALGGRSD